MLNKNVIIYLVLLLFITMGCQGIKSTNKMVLKCNIFPTGITSKTYSIKVYEDGSLNVIFGDKGQTKDSDSFERVINDTTIIIKDADLKIITDLQAKVLTLDEVEKDYTKKGGWEVILIVNEKKYHFYHGELSDTPIGKLVEELKRCSPVKIDIHSWS
ncbi:hypothetical protein EYV94_28020 [Puteibacter caeruleilacunae]|nr:hypothetical protein EYV94_28020 [Puteibacter caeruleilacunae]